VSSAADIYNTIRGVTMNWYLDVLKSKYAQFSGRARRKEYWMFFLFNLLVSIGLGIVDGITGTSGMTGLGLLGALYFLAVLVPGIAVTVRRLHDTDRSGLWILIGLVPLIGAIVLLVFMCMDGTPAENQFGPSPKGATA
jgi:uncharacterized membrane protein YhaH (DUF805 family)